MLETECEESMSFILRTEILLHNKQIKMKTAQWTHLYYVLNLTFNIK